MGKALEKIAVVVLAAKIASRTVFLKLTHKQCIIASHTQ
jgi:hypothetical protein